MSGKFLIFQTSDRASVTSGSRFSRESPKSRGHKILIFAINSAGLKVLWIVLLIMSKIAAIELPES